MNYEKKIQDLMVFDLRVFFHVLNSGIEALTETAAGYTGKEAAVAPSKSPPFSAPPNGPQHART